MWGSVEWWSSVSVELLAVDSSLELELKAFRWCKMRGRDEAMMGRGMRMGRLGIDREEEKDRLKKSE